MNQNIKQVKDQLSGHQEFSCKEDKPVAYYLDKQILRVNKVSEALKATKVDVNLIGDEVKRLYTTLGINMSNGIPQ